jgi:iron complex outermembrane receptor protein
MQIAASVFAVLLWSSASHAQSSNPSGQPSVTLPTVTVVAQKEPADLQKLPVSVTAVTADWLRLGDIRLVSDAAIYSPNTFFSDFTVRKLTNPRFRGLGSGPSNPTVTTFIDGVPHLNSNSSSIDLLDVNQVEFVRGPQSSLFGRNTLGGLVNVTSARPSLTGWTGGVSVPFGDYDAREVRGNISGPVSDRLGVGFSLSHAERDGFTTNVLTGNDLDSRSATSMKGQLLWTPANWETRVIVSGERARDGDYALNDLDALRARPHEAARDFEGRSDRDIFSTTIGARRELGKYTFSSTTGIVRWKTRDLTDLDYTPLPAAVRDNQEEDVQFTQEVRFASSPAGSWKLSDRASLAWQTGAFFFTQRYEQLAVNSIAPFVISQFVPFAVEQTSPEADLDDYGISLYAQGTATLGDRLDLIAGARFDHENRKALLNTSFDPIIAPPTSLDAEESFSNVSPQFAAVYRFQPQRSVYGSVARGFKAGGFNPVSPAGSEQFDEEHAWHLEGGIKTLLAGNRVRFNAAAFYIDWNDLQLNIPTSATDFYIANIGNASSKGFELELAARANEYVDLFSSFGVTNARFGANSSANGGDVSDNRIPNTPEYTATFGAQLSKGITSAATAYGLGEIVLYGPFKYDEANLQEQDSYSIANFRAGVRWKYVFAEGWIRNAFDTDYIPVAFPYGSASGFIGESGRPRTFGVTGGVRF